MRGNAPHLRLALAAAFAVAAAGGTPAQAHHSYPATYSGSAASGGTVEFDVNADGTAVTRFAVTNVPTTCGTIDGTANGSYAISDHAFSNGSPSALGLRFTGSFPSVQSAQGTLSFRSGGFPSCTSSDVNWSASTSAPPPAGGAPPSDGPAPPPAGGAPPPDTSVELEATAPRSQRALRRRGVVVFAECPSEPCSAQASGFVSIPRARRASAARRFRLRGVRRSLAAGDRARLKLRLSSRVAKRVRAALRNRSTRNRVRARVTLSVLDASANEQTEVFTVKIKR